MDLQHRLIITKPFFFSNSHCGYCDQEKSSSFGFFSEQITPEQYDQLINIGFRRSGEFLYKPDLVDNCCQYFTIRTNNKLFSQQKSREFRKIVNKFNKFIGNEPNTAKEFDMNNELDKIIRKGNSTPSSTSIDEEEFVLKFEPNFLTEEKFELYKKYQIHIHNDKESELTQSSFERFLCTDSFTTMFKASYNKDKHLYKIDRFGAAHQCYYHKGKLIAIGVLDILPSGVSSVYFLYDPDYKHLQLGKLSTLVELRVTELLGLEYYYMGFYIPNIVKMKYKKAYGGELLDQVLDKWVSFDQEQEVVDRQEQEVSRCERKAVSGGADADAGAGAAGEYFPDDERFIGDYAEKGLLPGSGQPNGQAQADAPGVDYERILVFDLDKRAIREGAEDEVSLQRLVRIIGRLSEECVVKVW